MMIMAYRNIALFSAVLGYSMDQTGSVISHYSTKDGQAPIRLQT